MGTMVKREIESPFVRVKANSEKGIFILADAMLKVMCVINPFVTRHSSSK